MSKKSTRGTTPVRSLRVPDKFWHRWNIAAKVAGIDRNKFVMTVVNHAADVILTDYHKDDEVSEEAYRGVEDLDNG